MSAERMLQTFGRFSFGAGLAGMIGSQCLFNVDGGEQAVMFNHFGPNQGVSNKIYSEGTHFMVPWLQKPTKYTIRTRAKDIPTKTGTKDLQQITLTVRLLFRPSQEHLPEIHMKLGPKYDEATLPSVGQEVMKSVVAKYDAEQVLTQRAAVSQEIRRQITERCLPHNIILDDVAVTDIQFSKKFAKAIEDKQIAEQEAERQAYLVEEEKQKKYAKIELAQGEAKAAAMMSRVFENVGTGMLEVKRINAARDIAETLSQASNVMYLPGGGAGGGAPNILLSAGQL